MSSSGVVLADTKQTSDEIVLQKAAQSILEKVHQVCTFGSTNKGPARSEQDNFFAVLKAINWIFNPRGKGSSTFIIKMAEYMHTIALLKEKSPVSKWTYNSEHFKRGTEVHYVPLTSMVSPKSQILEIIKKIFPPNKFDFTNTTPEKLCAPFAAYYKECMLLQEFSALRSKDLKKLHTKLLTEIEYNKLTVQGVASNDTVKKIFFFEQTMNYAKTIAFDYAYGNCSHMADIVLLEAIERQLPGKITYLRFEGNNIEEVNVIALGEWPKAGCLIINPWGGEKGVTFTWKGSIKKTPEISHYEKFIVIFSVTSKKEKKEFKKMLEKDQYQTWLNESQRNENMKQIKKWSEEFVAYLQKSGMIIKPTAAKKDEKTPESTLPINTAISAFSIASDSKNSGDVTTTATVEAPSSATATGGAVTPSPG